MSSLTPCFSITASSSFCTSSKVKPYWKPEQPPPVTKTRSLSSVLPSSSISCFTLFAALSLKGRGAGISVTAFIPAPDVGLLAARSKFQFYALRLGPVMHQAAFDDRALVDLDALVMHVPFDPRACLEFEGLGRLHRPVDDAVHDDMRGLNLAVDAGVGGNHQRAGLIRKRGDVTAHHAVDPQPAAENHLALDARGRADQAVDQV